MRTLVIILLACSFSTSVYSQLVTLTESNVPLRKILVEIKKQTGYYFSLGDLKINDKFTINFNKIPLKEALDEIFKNKPYSYKIVNRIIVVLKSKARTPIPVLLTINGKVVSESGDPLSEATILVLNTYKGALTNSKGEFTLEGIPENSTIQISSIGYELKQYIINNPNSIEAKLKIAASGLDEAVVIGYGKTSHRLNTGNVFKVRGQEIAYQPVSNFIAALSGRVPGLLISQVNGIPGTAYKSQIQGRSSIGATFGIVPDINVLIIVDGVPYAPNNNNLPTISSGSSLSDGRNSFDLINTFDIESIEVLKDADATAIYGSRGANGVILITTKKGIRGKTAFNLNINTGLESITRYPEMMNTEQYLKLRRSAILNDGNTPNATNAPDLLKWDTSRYTNFKQLIIGGTSKVTNANLSISGGQKQITYLLGSSLKKQTTVFPGNFNETSLYLHGNTQYTSANKRLSTRLGVITTHDNNLSPSRDMTTYVNLPPNAPAFYDSTGNLIWQEGGYAFNNPMSILHQPYRAITDNILLNFNSSYGITDDLAFKINMGLNNISSHESIIQPRTSFNTFANPRAMATSYFANTKLKSWIVEPQIGYVSRLAKGKLSILLGSTYQQLNTRIINYTAYFANDSYLDDRTKATTLNATPTNADYKYVGVFSRICYNLFDKYLINLTGRRDGTSRFSTGKQFGNFGAIGAAWIFSKEPLIYQSVPFLSFGKIRASYGITGSDQVGDYKYLDKWIQAPNTYQGRTGIIPIAPANPNYSWEESKKFSFGIDLGFVKDRLLLTTDFYRNRVGNQIVSTALPAITGFNMLPTANYPAVVQNSGWEFILQLTSIKKKDCYLNSRVVLTIPKNKLLSFPNIFNSPYSNRDLVIGQPLYSISGFSYTDIDKSTGLFTFKDFDNDGTISYPNDYSIIGTRNQEPRYYGSLLNNLVVNNFEIECLVEYKNQMSYNFLYAIYDNKPPGGKFNQPALFNNYWEKAGDRPYIQKPTASINSPAHTELGNFLSSSAVFSDASYLKIKYVSLSYRFSSKILHKLQLKQCRFYLSSNNLAIFTSFKATDPETINTFTLPALRTVSAGLQMAF